MDSSDLEYACFWIRVWTSVMDTVLGAIVILQAAHGHGKILGGGIVGTHAGDMIGEIAPVLRC
jgi:pyruvate/2-oxoglutarate dehydrogenase complex dihydrolipoamide dehydrogenase (E3) component